MDRSGLAGFLTQRRHSLSPADVGYAPGSRRRTPGLRREEIAALTGISVDYYTRLEQGRGPQPSEQVLIALTRTLRLSLDERDHLFDLAGHTAPTRLRRGEHVAPALLRVLDRLHDTPAQVISDLGVVLAQNPAGVALLGDSLSLTGFARSAYYRWFADPAVVRPRHPVSEHEVQSRRFASYLRAALGRAPGDAWAAAMIEDLLGRSPEFAEIWARHEVSSPGDVRKTLLHPELGEIVVNCQVLFTENRAQALLVYTAEPGTADADKLALLALTETPV